MRIYGPEGAAARPAVTLSPPHPVLAGRRIGILDNSKPNAGLLLGRIAQRLAARTGASVTVVEGKNAALPAPDDVLARLAEAQVVLTGSAD